MQIMDNVTHKEFIKIILLVLTLLWIFRVFQVVDKCIRVYLLVKKCKINVKLNVTEHLRRQRQADLH